MIGIATRWIFARCYTAPHRTAPHRTEPHCTAPHHTAPHRTPPHRASSAHLLTSSPLRLLTSSPPHLLICSSPHLLTSSPPHLFTLFLDECRLWPLEVTSPQWSSYLLHSSHRLFSSLSSRTLKMPPATRLLSQVGPIPTIVSQLHNQKGEGGVVWMAY